MISRLLQKVGLYRPGLGASEDYASMIDEPWYRRQYRDVLPPGLSPVAHYAAYGAAMGCDPNPFFSTLDYLTDNPELEATGQNPLWHYLTRGRAKGAKVKMSRLANPANYPRALMRQPARNLETKLWGGFSKEVLPLLRAKLVSPDERNSERSFAAWALACWSAFHKDYAAALAYLAQRLRVAPEATYSKAQVLLEVDALVRLGREQEAYERLSKARRALGRDDVDLLLSLSNVFVSAGDAKAHEQRLAAINKILHRAGFSSVAITGPGKAPNIFALQASASTARDSERAKVSVLMPAYNAGAQIELAVNSLLCQSWHNLEILVADDCSTDDTRARVKALAKNDSRIRLVPTERNGGAYAARNHALRYATGDFITVHDSDDWSHPEKLEVQARYLLNHPGAIATITDWARVREDLYFTGTFRAHGSLTSENTSSLMFRREAVERLGEWDLARTSADTEFLLRLKRVYGDEAVVRLHRGIPLAFALDQETSLTRTGVTHAKTLFYGARREYREAAELWHELSGADQLRLPIPNKRRPFPIPSVMQTEAHGRHRHYDIVVISDFNLNGGAFVSTMNYVNAAIALGKSVAVFHWRRADMDVTVPLKPAVRERALRGEFDILTAGEPVEANLVLAGYPVVLNYRLDFLPQIKAERFGILVNQMASRLTTGGDLQYDPERIHNNVRDLFNLEPIWIPISGLVQRLMREHGGYPEPHNDVWNPLLDVDNWCQDPVRWRGAEREMPILGRHSRDHYTKWPATAEVLKKAYCVGEPCEVRLLGGADHALSLLGEQPGNWTVLEFADSSYHFLRELDFFIHYPHEQYIEEFGRAVLEAMGLGIPVILSPVFEETFGPYAQYAQPHEVWPLVMKLWRDEEAYRDASEKCLAFVQRYAQYQVLGNRLERLRQEH